MGTDAILEASPSSCSLLCASGSSGRLSGDGSGAVVVDDLDVVPVGVEDKRAVVARVVDRALSWRAVGLVALRQRGGVKRAHRSVLARGEREVHVLRRRP